MYNSQDPKNLEEEININFLINFFLRNKFLIILFLVIGTFGGYLYSISLQKIWKGSFQIDVKAENEDTRNNVFLTLNRFNLGGNAQLKTQKSILTSPSVLMPVFQYVKNKSNSKEMTFKEWSKSSLDVSFEDGTTILDVAYKSSNRDLINEVLEMISERYKEYSILAKETNITKGIEYLINQEKIYTKKSKESIEQLNQFSLKNGLGEFNGVISSNSKSNINEDIGELSVDNANLYSIKTEESFDASKRFSRQFQMLEEYESEYLKLSSKLKPTSNTLTILELKINKIKESLKRPLEILIEYRELAKNANRHEIILNSLKQNLNLLKLEKERNRETWNLISNPQVEKNNFYPNIKRLIILFFIASFFASLILAYGLEKKSGKIYEFQVLKKLINAKYLSELFIDDIKLSKRILDNQFLLEKNKNHALLFVCDDLSQNLFINKNLFNDKRTYKFYNLDNINSLEEIDELVVVIKLGEIKNHQLKKLNVFFNLYNEKIKGWYLLKNFNSKY